MCSHEGHGITEYEHGHWKPITCHHLDVAYNISTELQNISSQSPLEINIKYMSQIPKETGHLIHNHENI